MTYHSFLNLIYSNAGGSRIQINTLTHENNLRRSLVVSPSSGHESLFPYSFLVAFSYPVHQFEMQLLAGEEPVYLRARLWRNVTAGHQMTLTNPLGTYWNCCGHEVRPQEIRHLMISWHMLRNFLYMYMKTVWNRFIWHSRSYECLQLTCRLQDGLNK